MSTTPTPTPPPAPDLRALATIAAHDMLCVAGRSCDSGDSTLGPYAVVADAVLTAVLPAHRQQVLREVVDAVVPGLDAFESDLLVAPEALAAFVHARARRLAATAPADSPSATLPAQHGPAVPEQAAEEAARYAAATGTGDRWDELNAEIDRRRIPEQSGPIGRFRVGRKLGRTLYRDEQFIGVMDTRELAEMVVAALNGNTDHRLVEQLTAGRAKWKALAEEMEGDRDRLAAELAEARESERILDEDLTGTTAQRDRLAVDLRRYEPVIETAKAWYAACDPGAITAPDVRRPAVALGAAVAALSDTDTGQRERLAGVGVEAAKVWRVARNDRECGGMVFHRARAALDSALAALSDAGQECPNGLPAGHCGDDPECGQAPCADAGRAQDEEPDPLWNLLDAPKPGYCCQDAYASTARRPGTEVVHTSGCPNRCSTFTPIPRAAERDLPAGYPCGLTAGHLGEHWIHPDYREPTEVPDGR